MASSSDGEVIGKMVVGYIAGLLLLLGSCMHNYGDAKMIESSRSPSIAAAGDAPEGTLTLRAWTVGPTDSPVVAVQEYYKSGKNAGWKLGSRPLWTFRMTDLADRSVMITAAPDEYTIEGGQNYPDPAHWLDDGWRLRGYPGKAELTVVCVMEGTECRARLITDQDPQSLLTTKQTYYQASLFGIVIMLVIGGFVVISWLQS